VDINNNGANSVLIDSLRLTFTRGSYTGIDTIYTVPPVVPTGTNFIDTLYVNIENTSPTGIAILNANVFTRDSLTDEPIDDLSSDDTDVWLIQEDVNILITNVTPTQVSQGQVFQPQINLQNTGQARLVVDTTLTRLQINGSTRSLTHTLIIEGLATETLTFEADSVGAVPATYPFNLTLNGIENGAVFDSTFTLLIDSLTLQTPSNIVIDSLIASVDTVTQNWDTTATLYLTNTGQADFILDSIMVDPYGSPLTITPGLPDTIQGDSSDAFLLNINIPALAATGTETLEPLVYGRDINSDSFIVSPDMLLT